MIRLQAELLEQAEALQAGWEAIGVFLIMTVWGTTDGPLRALQTSQKRGRPPVLLQLPGLAAEAPPDLRKMLSTIKLALDHRGLLGAIDRPVHVLVAFTCIEGIIGDEHAARVVSRFPC